MEPFYVDIIQLRKFEIVFIQAELEADVRISEPLTSTKRTNKI
jgi:hypothetical protein